MNEITKEIIVTMRENLNEMKIMKGEKVIKMMISLRRELIIVKKVITEI